MEIHLQSLNWYPDEADTDVLVDFTMRSSAIADYGNGGRGGEATDHKFRICLEHLMPEVGIRIFPVLKLEIESQRAYSDVDALIVIPHDTWTQIRETEEHEKFIDWLTLIVGKMYLTGQHSGL